MRRAHTPAILLAAGIGVVLVSGLAVTADAAATSHGFSACATGKGQLVLLSDGRCPSGAHKVSVGTRGAAGKTGPSDVYVAVSTSSSKATTPTLKVPAGKYLVTWSATVVGSFASGDNNEPYSVNELCHPALAGKDGPEGPSADVLAPLVEIPAPSSAESASFAGTVTAGGQWAVSVARGGTLEIRCTAPTVIDFEGTTTSFDLVQTTGQLTAMKTASIHGSDTYLP